MTLENWQINGFGLYLHWPFCETKCPYCDFNSYANVDFDESHWLQVYCEELEKYAAETGDRVLSSIYFGGGTPSLMSAKMVGRLLAKISDLWKTSNNVEITLEANPSTVEASRFLEFKSAGINRVSLGVQALNDIALAKLGRKHNAKEAIAAMEIVKQTFSRSSFDLIYARQNQSIDEWKAELQQALSFSPNHISLYQLTIEPGTVFAKRFNSGHLHGLPSDDQGADMYEMTQEFCEKAGLPAYEVSNHAAPGQESIHNFIYWNSGDYVGVGPGAHGRLTLENKRVATSTVLHPENWLKNETKEFREYVPKEEQLTELFLMGLRTSEGVCIKRAKALGYAPKGKTQDLVNDGMLKVTPDKIRVTAKGRPLLNAILREILA